MMEAFLLLALAAFTVLMNFVVRANVNHFEFLVNTSYHAVVAMSYLLLFYHLYSLLKFIHSFTGIY